MNFGISWLPKTINYKIKKTFGKKILFLILQVSDNNLFYLEAIHNFVEVSHDDESTFWPWRIKYFQNLPVTSKHMHNSYELSDFLEHKHVM